MKEDRCTYKSTRKCNPGNYDFYFQYFLLMCDIIIEWPPKILTNYVLGEQ